MHFSIPDTEQLWDDRGNKYTAYNLHLNGKYHCSVRYKQLHNFHEQLQKIYGHENVPFFPPKKVFSLSTVQIDERRLQLERFMQCIGQSSLLRDSDFVTAFLLSAQQESFSTEVSKDVSLNIFLMNNNQVSVTVNSSDGYVAVLERVCNELCVPQAYMYYFALFLVSSNDSQFSILRKLQNYESPYISQKNIPGSLKLYLMKNYWDLEYDLELMRDPVGLDLLYAQAVAEVRRESIVVHSDTKKVLKKLETTGAKKEYVELARELKYYGFIEFEPCVCDFPKPNTNVLINIGLREINFRIRTSEGEIREGTFKVTRMRCWRVTMNKDESDESKIKSTNSAVNNNKAIQRENTELAFEYLLAKNKLQWITILSHQAILMSNLLQSIIDELVIKRTHDMEEKTSRNLSASSSFYYMKRDGSSQITSPSISSSELDSSSSIGSIDSKTMSIKRLSDKLSSVNVKVTGKSPFVENYAFEGIGDEDL